MIPSSFYCPTCGAANATDNEVCFACKQPLDATVDENKPLLQGRYRILNQVGRGGFGAVYRTEDTQQQNAIVAIKQINLRGLTPQETIEATDAFNREVSLLANLDSPSLPHIHDNFTDAEHWYLVMDFIEGETLETYLEAKDAHYTMPLSEVLALGIQLCTVLDYLHTREPAIIFRDLKPANIMRTHAKKLYLIDFGIARRFNPAKLKDTIPFGSPGYAAPEQYGKAQTTARADIYSLGALLHMLLTGDDPVDNPFHFSPLRLYGSSGLASLEKLIMRMVELKADERPESVNEVKAELQRIENLQSGTRLWQPPVGQLPAVSNGGGQQQLYLPSKSQQQIYMPPAQRTQMARRKFVVGSLALVGLAAIGAGTVSVAPLFNNLHSYGGKGGEGPGAPPYQAAFGDVYTYPNHSASVRSVSVSSNNNLIASASSDGTLQIWAAQQVMQNDTKNVKPYNIYKAGGPVSAVAWTWGRGYDMLAFSKGKSISIWDLQKSITTFQAVKETGLGDAGVDITAFAWSPDGRYIAFPTTRGLQLYNVDTKKGDRHLTAGGASTPSSPDSITAVAWSPDNTFVAASTQDEKTFVWYVADGNQQLLTDMTFTSGRRLAWSPDSKWLATASGGSVFVTSMQGQPGSSTYFSGDGSTITALAWSSQSRFIAVGSAGNNENLKLWSPFGYDATTGTSNELATPPVSVDERFSVHIETNGEDIHSLAWAPDESYLVVGADKAYVVASNASALKM